MLSCQGHQCQRAMINQVDDHSAIKQRPLIKHLKQIRLAGDESSPAAYDSDSGYRSHSGSTSFDDLYKCRLKESADSLYEVNALLSAHSLRSNSNSNSRKKYILQDESPYDTVSNSPLQSHSFYKTTSFLKPLQVFTGYQVSGYKKYQVTVTLRTVFLPNRKVTSLQPHLTGELSIKGLTSKHPVLTTLFDSFVVTSNESNQISNGDNFGFLSSNWPLHPSLNQYKSDDRVDVVHWLNFKDFKRLFNIHHDRKINCIDKYLDGSRKLTPKSYLNQRYIFMRWKEKSLLPDKLNRSIEGASFDGYYYIVHDQLTGSIQGFYYHKMAERFQQLELSPVSPETKGHSFASFELS